MRQVQRCASIILGKGESVNVFINSDTKIFLSRQNLVEVTVFK